jgi:hypothetical protein
MIKKTEVENPCSVTDLSIADLLRPPDLSIPDVL